MIWRSASVPIPKFVSIQSRLWPNFVTDQDTCKAMFLVWFLDLKFASAPAETMSELKIHHTSGERRDVLRRAQAFHDALHN